MNQYRFVCIYETYKSPAHIELRIEVCLGSNTKSMSPFIRKVDIEELFHACVSMSAPPAQPDGFGKAAFSNIRKGIVG